MCPTYPYRDPHEVLMEILIRHTHEYLAHGGYFESKKADS